MSLRLLKIASLVALLSAPALLPAQIETTGKEEERLEALARSQGEWYAPKRRLSVGFRMLNSGGQVDFRNLGTIPSNRSVAPVSSGAVERQYTNGVVHVDSLRSSEKDANGNQTSTPGGRYDIFTTTTVNVVDDNGNVTGTEDITFRSADFLSYTPGLTRSWGASDDSQLSRPGYVSFSIYNATSDGGSVSHKQGATGGVEFQFARDLGRGSRHFQWGFVAGVTLNDINSKSSGTVNSTLHAYTDYFSLNGQVIDATQLEQPSFGELLDANGNQVSTDGRETTVPISVVPDGALSTNTAIVGGASVSGRWQVKGAYFMVKLGPSLRTQLTDHLGLTASVGVAGAYAGTRYSAYESYTAPDLPDVVLDTTEDSTAAKFVKGYFADVNVEWAANEALGLFGGVTAQQLSSYEQQLGDRTAKVDLGSAVGLRGGVTIRF